MLAALVLTRHDDTARQVRDAHRGLGLVDVLAAGARGTVDIHLEVRGIDLDLDVVVDLRRDEHRGEGGMAAVARIER